MYDCYARGEEEICYRCKVEKVKKDERETERERPRCVRLYLREGLLYEIFEKNGKRARRSEALSIYDDRFACAMLSPDVSSILRDFVCYPLSVHQPIRCSRELKKKYIYTYKKNN